MAALCSRVCSSALALRLPRFRFKALDFGQSLQLHLHWTALCCRIPFPPKQLLRCPMPRLLRFRACKTGCSKAPAFLYMEVSFFRHHILHRTCDCLLGLQCNTEVCGRSRRCRPHCDTILRRCRCCSFCNVFVAAESVRDAAGCCGSARLSRQQLVVIMRAF